MKTEAEIREALKSLKGLYLLGRREPKKEAEINGLKLAFQWVLEDSDKMTAVFQMSDKITAAVREAAKTVCDARFHARNQPAEQEAGPGQAEDAEAAGSVPDVPAPAAEAKV